MSPKELVAQLSADFEKVEQLEATKAELRASQKSANGSPKTPKAPSARAVATPLIREMRKNLAWSSETWKEFTVEDFCSRLEQIIEQANAALAAVPGDSVPAEPEVPVEETPEVPVEPVVETKPEPKKATKATTK